MFCSNCGKKLADGSKFCSGCGAKLEEITEKSEKPKKSDAKSNSIPAAASVYFEQGTAYLAQKDYKNAIKAFESVIDLAPDYNEAKKELVNAYFVQGTAYVSQKDYTNAIKEFKSIIDLAPDNYEAKKELVKVYNLSNKAKDAVDLLNKIIIEKPDDAEAFLLRAEIYSKSKSDVDQAIMDLTIAKKINPDYEDVYKQFALIYTSRKEWEKVIENCNAIININPKVAEYYLWRAISYSNENKIAETIEDCNNCLKIDKNNIDCIYLRFNTFYNNKQFDDALVDINELINKKPKNFDYLCQRGKIYLSKNAYKEAISDFEKCIDVMDKKDNQQMQIFEYHAEACLKNGDFEKFKEDYKKLFNFNQYYKFVNESCFIDGFVGFYQNAYNKYLSEKKTFMITENILNPKFVVVSDLVIMSERSNNQYARFQSAPFSSDEAPVIFLDKEIAEDFLKYPYLYTKSAFHRSKIKDDYKYQIIENDERPEPLFWFIMNMPSGKIYQIDEERKMAFIRSFSDTNHYPEKVSRFNTFEKALAVYKKIITLFIKGKGEFENINDDRESISKVVNSCTDLFILGTNFKTTSSLTNNNKQKETSSSNKTNTSNNSSNCFITSAVCRTFGKQNDCYELTTLRHFRDTFMMLSEEKKLEVNEYYKIAPEICRNIEKLEDSGNAVYRNIWENYLRNSLKEIESSNNEEAYMIYKKMVMDLKKSFL